LDIQFFGATREVTGSCFLLTVGDRKVLVDCGLIQGSLQHERHNHEPFPFDPAGIDAVVLTHAHLDHSGRLPLLAKRGYDGPIYTHRASADLFRIMLEDSGYLNEKEVEWENRKRLRKGLELVEPLYTRDEARAAHRQFRPQEYEKSETIVPGVELTLYDAGHILGSAIAVLDLTEGGHRRRVVFSGDLGHRGEPILRDPAVIEQADLVVMESTYGDRLHRPWNETWEEMGEIITSARGNILIPAFAVGRSQLLLHMFKRHYDEWNLGSRQIFLDSPLAIEATEVYQRHAKVYDRAARDFMARGEGLFDMPNLHLTRRSEESMAINTIRSGAVIIAGSGMCTGGRIKHHFKHNIWRRDTHVLIVGFQAAGTLGRSLVDGAGYIRLWGETVQVNAAIHTIGGLSAHADQRALLHWYETFRARPPVALVHGEPEAMDSLAWRLETDLGAHVVKPEFTQRLDLLALNRGG
jgi:metallo-beta-lactamase family protein